MNSSEPSNATERSGADGSPQLPTPPVRDRPASNARDFHDALQATSTVPSSSLQNQQRILSQCIDNDRTFVSSLKSQAQLIIQHAQAAQEPVAEPAGPAGPTNITYDQYTANEIRKMTLKDLRVELRARGLSPAGGKEALEERLLESVAAPPPPVAAAPVATAPALEEPVSAPGEVDGVNSLGQASGSSNSYARPDGQNCGNFLTDRNSSRVLAPPGGGSSITFG
ncbi:hypothetical protein CYMTET_37582 [Cymbomonas tetramitiformis]|uniref:SAP domain-containing protein n=1 Tax=Cymbomonas tetramitiformis TaxID=36881 RepID=A0AAE0CF91_9CHLO|nr:hypothetical protein CYMTET_37582 [Cymbomonas tetramitiformis]